MRILFVTSNRLGDAVLSTGLLDHLGRAGNARVTVACGPVPAPLFAAAPMVERVVVMTKRPRGGHWLDLWKSAVGTRWDLVVDLRASALAWTLAARRRLVYRPNKAPEHRVRQLGRLLGLEPPPAPRLWTTALAEAEARALILAGPPVLAVGPTANWGGKQWPAERFAAAVAHLTAPDGILPGARVAVFGAANEREAAQPVLDAIPAARRIDLVGGPGLVTVAACLKRCAFYLGNDSGLMHVAAAMDVPTLGLFGPSLDVHYAPWGPLCATVRTPESFERIVGAPGYDHRSQDTRMGGLTVETVTAAAKALWNKTRLAA